MPSYSKPLYYLFRRNKYILIGCLLGVLLSSGLMPPMFGRECRHDAITMLEPAGREGPVPAGVSATAEMKLNSADYQRFLTLEGWFREMSTERFNPVLRNQSISSTAAPDSNAGADPSQDLASNMVRDKKLKFYRPRFHSIELNVKMKLLICVVIRQQFLIDQLERKKRDQAPFYRRLIGQYINFTSYSMLSDFRDHILYFYPDPATTKNKLLVVANGNDGREMDRWPWIESQPYHVQMLDYVIKRNRIQEYALVLMMTEQTMVHPFNLHRYLERLTVGDYVFSISGSASATDFGSSDLIMHQGLMVSSTLIQKCQINWSCYGDDADDIDKIVSGGDGNTHRWHRSFWFETPPEALNQAIELLRTREAPILDSIFLFPMPNFNSESFGLLQALISVDTIVRLKCELGKVESSIRIIKHENRTLFQEPPGSFQSHKPRNRYEVIRWTYWNETHSIMPDELQVARPLTDDELEEVAFLRQKCLDYMLARETLSERLHEVKIQNLYRKFDAVRGLEYLLDLSLSPFEVFRFQILKPLNPVELVADIPHRATESLRLTLILPVRGHQEVPLAIAFLNQYAQVCRKNVDHHQTILIVVLIRTRYLNVNESIESALDQETKEFERLKKVSLYLQTKIVFLDVNPPDPVASGPLVDQTPPVRARFPSELVYLDLIGRSLTASGSEENNLLLLHCRAGMTFTIDLLNRVRTNTIAGHQIFIPLPFVEYRLRTTVSNDHFRQIILQQQQKAANFFLSIAKILAVDRPAFDVRKDHGYFDETNNEFVAFYLRDYIRARKRSASLMPVVRNRQSIVKYQNLYYDAELDLYRMFRRYNQDEPGPEQQFILMRAVEPELRLPYTSILDDCDHFESNRFAFETCQRRRWFGLGPKPKLAAVVLQYLGDSQKSFSNSTTL